MVFPVKYTTQIDDIYTNLVYNFSYLSPQVRKIVAKASTASRSISDDTHTNIFDPRCFYVVGVKSGVENDQTGTSIFTFTEGLKNLQVQIHGSNFFTNNLPKDNHEFFELLRQKFIGSGLDTSSGSLVSFGDSCTYCTNG